LTNNGTAATPRAIDFNIANFQPSADSGAANALTLGGVARRWNGFYLSNDFVWNGITIVQPTGDATKYLNNNGQWTVPASSTGGVSTFNGRTGAVTLNSADVTTALGYTPPGLSVSNTFTANQILNGVTVGLNGSYLGAQSNTTAMTLGNSTTYVAVFTGGGTTSFLPATDNNINLGASGFTWKTLYLTGAMYWNGVTVTPPSGGTTFLRNDGSWQTVYQSGGALGTPASGNFSSGSFTWPTFNQSTTGNALTATTASSATTAGGLTGTLSTSSYTLSSSNNLMAFSVSGGNGFFINGSGAAVAPGADNVMSLGTSGFRWTTVYATTGTINTSDANQKQQIADLSEAEKAVARSIKSLIKTFKFNDAVAAKGSAARKHVGVIAQDVQTAFAAQGLNAEEYGIFCSDTVDGNTQLGVRYEELLAFVIASL
jgi:hypothetical protein